MPKNRPTQVERLVNTSVGSLMGQRRMFARHVKRRHGLKVEEGVLLAHVRVDDKEGKVVTATILKDDAAVDRSTATRGLKKLLAKKLIVPEEIRTPRKEIAYHNPDGFAYAADVLDDAAELIVDQIKVGRELTRQAAKLTDPTMKARLEDAARRAGVALAIDWMIQSADVVIKMIA